MVLPASSDAVIMSQLNNILVNFTTTTKFSPISGDITLTIIKLLALCNTSLLPLNDNSHVPSPRSLALKTQNESNDKTYNRRPEGDDYQTPRRIWFSDADLVLVHIIILIHWTIRYAPDSEWRRP